MHNSAPKVMVVTQFGPNASGGGPAVIRQALQDYDRSRVGWWSCLPEKSSAFGFEPGFKGGFPIPAKLYPNKKAVALKGRILETVWSRLAAASLRRSVVRWKPDVLWVIPHMWSIFPMHAFLAKRPDVPFHITVQDYMDMSANVPLLGLERGKRLAGMACELYANAFSADATSPPMVEDLARATGRTDGHMLHLGLEKDDFAYLDTPPVPQEETIHIAYAGTVQVEEVFVAVVRMLEQIRSKPGAPGIILDFFGNHSYARKSWFSREWMIEHGNLNEIPLRQALRKCSLGLAPMALLSDDRYNRFSFPTKFISYLAAGLPVLAVGHRDASVMRMAREFDTGWSWDTADFTAMTESLSTWLSIPDRKARYRENVKRCAQAHFDADRMRNRLYQDFARAAQKS